MPVFHLVQDALNSQEMSVEKLCMELVVRRKRDRLFRPVYCSPVSESEKDFGRLPQGLNNVGEYERVLVCKELVKENQISKLDMDFLLGYHV